MLALPQESRACAGAVRGGNSDADAAPGLGRAVLQLRFPRRLLGLVLRTVCKGAPLAGRRSAPVLSVPAAPRHRRGIHCAQIFTRRYKTGVWDLTAFVDSGGMPSSHSSLCTVRRSLAAFTCTRLGSSQLLCDRSTDLHWADFVRLQLCSDATCLATGCDHRGCIPVWPWQRAVCGRAVLQPGGYVRRGRRTAACGCHPY